ncbi:MAG: peptide chain release factor N(5)-glutamine methyltransferase [Erysipelotrichaceae bacterium]|nr:peptide chain release factor N(5)-glutamine methyltransferase [Erysipelotrichaceae bacterium]
MKTYNQLIHEYKKIFYDKGLSPEVVKAFIYELCNEKNINLYMDMDKEVNEDIFIKFNEGIERLMNNEPMNYVLGYSYFYGYKMIVNKDVLIPRPETEELVGLILSQYDTYYKGQSADLCDVGTGSGAIGIALKKEEDNLNVYASDISKEALEVAKRNCINNECSITYLLGSMLDPYIENNIKVDILVSNPPYIKTTEDVDPSVYDFEPHVALFGGEDGLRFYREIFEKAPLILNDKAMMFFEMGYDQKERLSALAKSYFPMADVEVFKDINGKDRMLMISIR